MQLCQVCFLDCIALTQADERMAAISPISTLDHIVSAFPTVTINGKLWVKVSVDGVALGMGNSAEGLSLSIYCGSEKLMSDENVFYFGVGAFGENTDYLRELFKLAKIEKLVKTCEETVTLSTGKHNVSLFFVADWAGLQKSLGFKAANAGLYTEDVCFCCSRTKESIGMQNFAPTNDIFEIQSATNNMSAPYSTGNLPGFKLEQIRYDWMHGFGRLCCNVLEFLLPCLPSTKRQEAEEALLEYLWRKDNKVDVKKLAPDEVKIVLGQEELLHRIASLFDENDHHFVVPSYLYNAVKYHVSPRDAVLKLLLAVEQFVRFAYTPWPNINNFRGLDVARQIIVATFVANSWRFHAAPHYLLNHALEFLLRDGTAYFFVQEGVERANRLFRSWTTMGHGSRQERCEDVIKKHLFSNITAPLSDVVRAWQAAEKLPKREVVNLYTSAKPTPWYYKAVRVASE